MKASAFKKKLTWAVIFLCLFSLIFMLWNFNIRDLEEERQMTSANYTFKKNMFLTKIVPPASAELKHHSSYCSHKYLSPEEAQEERFLLDSITWPETPQLPTSFSLEQTSDPAHSTFTILPANGGGQRHVGDQLEALIQVRDFQDRPKSFGGDFLIAKLHSPDLGAGVAGQIVDYLNGSYSATFPLLWNGSARVEVMLVHPSEAITVLRRVNKEQPNWLYFTSRYSSGSDSVTTICNVCLPLNEKPVCNHTDLRTGDPWFCYKPENLSCNTRIIHSVGGRQNQNNITAQEEKLFTSDVNMKVSIPASGSNNITVLPKEKGQPEVMKNSVKPGPSGYYYQNVWRSLDSNKIRQFNTSSDIIKCLKGKKVHIYGDSTGRQWYFYLHDALQLKQFITGHKKWGPFVARDIQNNITVMYRSHGPPLHYTNVSINELRYTANEIDGLAGGSNTVVVISIWAHFGAKPLEVYIWRLLSIRKALVKLFNRAPDTVVVIRTANLKELTLLRALISSDWYSLQHDKLLRAVFKGMKVHLVDAWDMTLAHHLPHNIHPQLPIIKNMVNVLLSHICDQRSD